MAHLKLPRGVERDVAFNLLSQPGGSLIDDADWVDGSTDGEWPTVEFLTQGGSPVDVTADWVKDITADTITGAIKHPDPTTGLWRKSQGRYRVRIIPDAALTLGDYDLRVTYDVGGAPFPEKHTITLTLPGDVDFGSTIAGSIEVADVIVGISTSLSSADIEALILEATEWVEGWLEDECGLDPDVVVADGVPNTIRNATILYTRFLIFQRDASAGTSSLATMRKEGTKQVRYSASTDTVKKDFLDGAEKAMMRFCKEHSPYTRARVRSFRQDPTIHGVWGE